jgi:cytochrome c553
MRGSKLVLSMAALAALTLSNPVSAESIADGAKVADEDGKGQQIAVQVCAACHNADGNSLIPAYPSLAGQHAEYITKQLKNFKSQDGKPAERENPVMAAMVAPLSPGDMEALGEYYAKQTPQPRGARNESLAEEGERIYRGGNLETSLPACAGCHNPDGAGIPKNYPRLAGQHSEYVAAQLRAFRNGQRTRDLGNQMYIIATRMSEKEIQAVSEFISGLR